MYEKVLLAADGSEHALRATEHAIKFVRQYDSQLDVVIVVDEEEGDITQQDQEAMIERRLKLTKQKLNKANVSYQTVVLTGEPKHEIVEYAKAKEVDLCFVGSRGLNRLQEMVLGSVSHKLAKNLSCPVIIIK